MSPLYCYITTSYNQIDKKMRHASIIDTHTAIGADMVIIILDTVGHFLKENIL